MFDHLTWVSMTEEGPVLANLRLDGILAHDVADEATSVLSSELIKSVFFDSNVFVDAEEHFQNGKALLTYQNGSNQPLFLDAKFYHNHFVQPYPSEIKLEIPAKSTKTIAVDLKAISPFNINDKVQLELEGSLGFDSEEYPDLKLSGTNTIPVKVSNFNVLPTESAAFIDTYQVTMANPPSGTQIRYTINDRQPTVQSTLYTKPLVLKKTTRVKAALFTEDGMMSTIDELTAKKINEQPGLMCSYYEYSRRTGGLSRVPDFSLMQPKTIHLSERIDISNAGQRNQFFGVVYQSQLKLPKAGVYKFTMISDDGAILLIDGQEVLNDAVKHKKREVVNQVNLSAGNHALEIQYYQHKKGMVLDVFFETPGGQKVQVNSDNCWLTKDN